MTAPRRRNGASVEFIQRSCEGKRRFSDEITARAVGHSRQEDIQQNLYVYQCRFCRGWHLTRNNNGKRKAVDFYTRRQAHPKQGKE